MIRTATGENWHELMFALSRENHPFYQCNENPTFEDYKNNNFQQVGCGMYKTSIVFFLSFAIIVSLVFLNLFIAIILEGFEDTLNNEEKLFNQETTDYFREKWAKYDPYATCYMKLKNF